MLELAGDLRFVHETEDVFAGELRGGLDDFHRNGAVDAEVARLIHDAHAAAPDGAEDFVFFAFEKGAHRGEPEVGVPQ